MALQSLDLKKLIASALNYNTRGINDIHNSQIQLGWNINILSLNITDDDVACENRLLDD